MKVFTASFFGYRQIDNVFVIVKFTRAIKECIYEG